MPYVYCVYRVPYSSSYTLDNTLNLLHVFMFKKFLEGSLNLPPFSLRNNNTSTYMLTRV